MIVLGLSTSADVCSIAVVDQDSAIAEHSFRHRMHLSERLIADVESVLKDAGIALKDLDGFAVDIGPGSFTGIRIGVMTAKTWADYLAKPLVSITALTALAGSYVGCGLSTLVSVIRARPGEVYACSFNADSLEIGSDTKQIPIAEFRAFCAIQSQPVLIIPGQSSANLSDIGIEINKLRSQFAVAPSRPISAAVIAAQAIQKIMRGEHTSPIELEPYYFAPPPIH